MFFIIECDPKVLYKTELFTHL